MEPNHEYRRNKRIHSMPLRPTQEKDLGMASGEGEGKDDGGGGLGELNLG